MNIRSTEPYIGQSRLDGLWMRQLLASLWAPTAIERAFNERYIRL